VTSSYYRKESAAFLPHECTIYNMSGRVVSDIQTRAEGRYPIQHGRECCKWLKNDSSYEFIGEVILKNKNKRCLSRENQS
jgi:hypothetical protein